MGADFVLPMPFLFEHGAPVGEVFFADPQPDGIRIKARFSRLDPSAPASLKNFLDTAWASVSATPPLVKGLSIGWKPKKGASTIVNGVRRVSKWFWGETSAVAVPMNAHALITSVKSLAAHDRASAVHGASPIPPPSAAAGSLRTTPMKISEQLTAEKASLQTKSAALEALIEKEETDGDLDAAELEQKSTLMSEIKAHAAKRDALETLLMAQVPGAVGLPAPGSPKPRVTTEAKTVELAKGTIFIRAAMAIAAGRGSESDTLSFAKKFTNTPEVLAFVKSGYWDRKAEVGMATLASPGWGSQLVNPGQVTAEFIDLLMPRTIIGKVQGFDVIPFNTLIIEQTGGSTFNWVGDNAPKPVGELAFDKTSLGFSKVAGIVVMSDELVRLSVPSAEAKARNDMIRQCAKFIDQQFIRVAVSAGASNPASITNGVSSPSATGTTAAALRHDLNIALATFDTSNEDDRSDDNLVIVMTPALARGISLLTTTLGVPEFPTMNPQGGTLLGYPVIVSSSVDSGTIVIFKPSEIYLADDGRVTLDASREATLDLSGSTNATYSLWQNNAIGLRAERWIRWQKKRATGVVAVIDTAAYAPA